VVAGDAVRDERQGEGEEPMEEQWRKGRHGGGQWPVRDSEVWGKRA
jgi:hypothetical protein